MPTGSRPIGGWTHTHGQRPGVVGIEFRAISNCLVLGPTVGTILKDESDGIQKKILTSANFSSANGSDGWSGAPFIVCIQ